VIADDQGALDQAIAVCKVHGRVVPRRNTPVRDEA